MRKNEVFCDLSEIDKFYQFFTKYRKNVHFYFTTDDKIY